MTDNITTTGFDYEGLSEDTTEFVQEATSEIHRLADRSARDIHDIGAWLIKVKARLPRGRFLLWLQAEFGWSDRTARRFMAVAEYKLDTVSNLNASAGALYVLTAPSAPRSAADEAARRSKAGEKITKKKAQDIVTNHTPRVITPPAPPITISKPDLSWEEQYFEQIDAHPDEVVFMIPGDRATMWVAMGVTANLIAEKTGTQAYPLAGSLPGIPPIPMVCVTITDPQTGKQDGQKVDDLEELLGKRTITYVESDMHLLALLRDTEKRLIDPTPIVQAKHDREAAEAAGRKPFGAPIPGMPTPHAAPVQFPPAGWQRLGVPPAPPEPVSQHMIEQPAIPLVIDAPEGESNGDIVDGEVLEQPQPAIIQFRDPAELRTSMANGAHDFPDAVALEKYFAACVEQMELAYDHFKRQVLSEQDQIDLEVIKEIWHAVGKFGDRMAKLSTLPEKIARVRADLESAQTAKDCEKVIGGCVQLKVGHEAKDRPVMEIMNQAQARLMALKAAA